MRMLLAAVSVMALAACQGEQTPAGAEETPPADAASGAAPAADGATPAADPAPPAAAPGAKSVDNAAFQKYVPWKSDQPEIQKPGGIEYVVLASGDAAGKPPTAAQQAEIFYEGRLNIGGPAFDSAFERNESATFPVGSVVPGFAQALQLMKPGDRWLVYIPSELGYGARGAGGAIPPNADLVFEIEMVAVR
jgi:FKBP-type peptidyl-prolyl cis-trans isomerase